MNLALTTVLLAAAESPGPQGDNPTDVGGILIIAGIAAAFLLVLLFAMYRRRTRA